MIRTLIRDRFREVLSKGLKGINRFGPRPKPISISDLPACLLHVATDERIKERSGYTERELKVILEFAIVPREDSESELFHWSDVIQVILLTDEGLKELTTEVFLDDIAFLTAMDGDTPIAALSQVYLVRYQSQRSKNHLEPLPREVYLNDELLD